MKKKLFFFLFALMGMTGNSAHLLAQELPEPDGMWTFSNADNLLAADKGTLQLLPAVTGRKSITLCELSEANITAAEGPSSTNAIMVPAASALKVQRLEGAEATTSYTLMMDVKVLDANAYDGLFQTNEGNTNDGDLFIYTNKIGMNAMGGYFGEIKDDTWYRIVLTNSEGKVKVYVDGEKLITCNSEGRWEIDPFGFYLFCDEDGEKVDTYVSGVTFWETPLTDEQVGELGGFKPANIATAADLVAFANRVNSGKTDADAFLTADIDMSGVTDFAGIGVARNTLYAGTFDGQGHKISNMTISFPEKEDVGFFHIAKATLKNFTLDETCLIQGNKGVGLVGWCNGDTPEFENIGVAAQIKGGENTSSFIGRAWKNPQFKNCWSVGEIDNSVGGGNQSNTGVFMGWCNTWGGSFTNCWTTATFAIAPADGNYLTRKGDNVKFNNTYTINGSQATKMTEDDVKSGALCYNLNGDQSEITWYQTIGQDEYPVLDATHGIVVKTANGYTNILSIGTAADLVAFSEAVNAGAVDAVAALTADIDMTGVTIEPIGTEANLFIGTFDGQGHVISNLTIEKEGVEYVGLFGRVSGGATIKNFTLKNAKLSGKAFIGIVGGSNNSGVVTLDKLGFEGEAIGTNQNVSGIIGVNMSSAATFRISNCYVTGKVTGGNESAAITGWTGGGQSSITGCWSTAEVSGNDAGKAFYRNDATVWSDCYDIYGEQVSAIPEGSLASGELAYKLNGNSADGAWRQTIGQDEHPVFAASSKKVYAKPSEGFRCDGLPLGDISYTNDEVVPELPAHEYDGFICKNCGQINPEFVQPKNGVYALGTAEQLAWFARKVNSGADKALNAVLTADIDMSAYPGVENTIGTDNNGYAGTFDGQFHTVKVAYVNNADGGTEVRHSTALFRFLNGGTVKNIITTGTITTNQKYASGLVGKTQGNGGTMENVETHIVINSAVDGDGTHAGFLGVADAPATITNALSAIVINGDRTTCCGGLSGWASQPVTFNNCLMVGEINVQDDGSSTFSRNPGGNTYNNCYYRDGVKELQDNGNATKVSADVLKSGELTYSLNYPDVNGGIWRQTLGRDAYPVINANHAVVFQVDGNYVNLPGDAFNIATAEDLFAYAETLKSGTLANAVLTADIDLGGAEWTAIGSGNGYGKAAGIADVTNAGFTGVFDGQGHTVSNFTIKDGAFEAEPEAAGLFGIVTGTVKNVGVINASYEASKDCRAGAVAGAVVASATSAGLVENCFVINSKILSGSRVVGGVAGAVYGGTVKNCFSANNELSGYGDRFGGVAGDTHSDNGWDGTVINCYTDHERVTSSQHGPVEACVASLSASDFASGVIAVGLGSAFRQNLGEDVYPVLDRTHGIVKEISEAGYATMYVADAVNAPEGVTAYTGSIQGSLVDMRPIEGTIPAWEPVVLKGAPGFYSFIPSASEKSTVVDFSAMGYENAQDLTGGTICVGDLDINFGNGTNEKNGPKYYNTGTAARLYGGNTMNIYALGQPITKIEFNFGPSNAPTAEDAQFSEGSYDVETYTWTGSAENVTLTRNAASGHYRIVSMKVTYGGGSNIEGNDLVGTAVDLTTDGSQYVLAQKEGVIGFYKANAGTVIAAGKAYLLGGAAGTKGFTFSFSDETAIETVQDAQEVEDVRIYDLSGRRVEKATKGIYIINGKKVLK